MDKEQAKEVRQVLARMAAIREQIEQLLKEQEAMVRDMFQRMGFLSGEGGQTRLVIDGGRAAEPRRKKLSRD